MQFVSAKKVILEDSGNVSIIPATIEIEKGKIVAIHKNVMKCQTDYPNAEWISVKDESIVMPGIVDAHVHINEPGRTQWEGFATATKAAAFGGVTTLIDMPLNAIPPTTTVENFQIKLNAASNPNQCFVDVGFYGGVIPNNENEIKPLVENGVRGFKCFMIESGVDEFPCVNEEQIRKALHQLKGMDTFLMFHAEMEDPKEPVLSPNTDSKLYSTFLNSRPRSLENRAIDLVIKLCRESNVKCHIVHLSSSDALPAIRSAKKEGLKLSVETCFHYLVFQSEDIPSGATQYKCCPPIRESKNREELWAALLDGTIDYVISDHSPCTPNLKKMDSGDFMGAWGGISSVQFGLPVLCNLVYHNRDGNEEKIYSVYDSFIIRVERIVPWICTNTAKQVGLQNRKGSLKVGFDADITIWSPEASFQVLKENIQFKNKVTPFEGKTLWGVVEKTIVQGRIVYEHDLGLKGVPSGEMLVK